jgi:hypothetical protein
MGEIAATKRELLNLQGAREAQHQDLVALKELVALAQSRVIRSLTDEESR